jgi:HK97 gp10 family phage protein
MAETKIVGLEDFGSTLKMLSQQMERKIIRAAVRKGGKVFAEEVELRAPKASGELAAEVTETVDRTREGGIQAKIGIRYKGKVAKSSRRPGMAPSTEDPGVYASWSEFGRPGKKGHTNQAAKPFMRPSFDAKQNEAEKVAADSIMQGIQEELK